MYWSIYERRCFGCVKENSADILYRKVLPAYFNITKLLQASEVLENDVKYLYFKRNILKNALPYDF